MGSWGAPWDPGGGGLHGILGRGAPWEPGGDLGGAPCDPGGRGGGGGGSMGSPLAMKICVTPGIK